MSNEGATNIKVTFKIDGLMYFQEIEASYLSIDKLLRSNVMADFSLANFFKLILQNIF